MSNDPKTLLRELIDEVLEEMSSTGAVAGYSTPNAFRGKRSKKADAEHSMPGGKVVGKEDADDTTVGERLVVKRSLSEDSSIETDIKEEKCGASSTDRHRNLSEGRYNNFKSSDEMKNHQKISFGINEAKKMLREVNFLIGLCERLKSEDRVLSEQLWKTTKPNLISINKQLKEISKRIYRIGKK